VRVRASTATQSDVPSASSVARLFSNAFPEASLWTAELRDEVFSDLSHNRGVVTLQALRSARRDEILHLAQQRGARNVRVFGSVARGEANENSDLDLLVDWESGRSLLDHSGLVQDLQELLGVKVHVGTEKSLHWYVRDRILREATAL
jgi:uncharacterized protein